MTSIRPSTVVRRTDAGRAELATPAHGLSLAQRRFLTLLDSAATVDALAQRHRLPPGKLERDLARLATLGFVACEEPVPANDAAAENAANDALPRTTAVRLGAPRAVRRAATIGAPLFAVALAWTAWQYGSTREPADGTRPVGTAKTGALTQAHDIPAIDPQPIATRVLRGEPAERTRDAGKDARAPAKRAEPPPYVDARPPAPSVQHRGPEPGAALDPSLTRAPMPSPAVDPAPMLLPMPSTSSVAAPALLPMPVAPSVRSEPAQAPVHVANAAPSRETPREASAPALVPIARETPAFPREALAAGLDGGSVKARLTIGADGNVESVDIVNASHRSFHRAVREALARWRFAPGAQGRTTDVDVAFKRD